MPQFALMSEQPSFLAIVRERLLTRFGPQADEARYDPVSQLIRAMIGTRTTDEVSGAAFLRLAYRYPCWDTLRHAGPTEIEPIIQPVTFADQKAAQIPQALRMIFARQGALSLDFLIDWDEEVAMHWLTSLPGVGPKIAAAVLNFSSLRKRELAVDTHLKRIGARLGLMLPDASFETAHDLYMRFIPNAWGAEDLYELHWLLKYHGQTTCHHAAPACASCVLRDLCGSSRR